MSIRILHFAADPESTDRAREAMTRAEIKGEVVHASSPALFRAEFDSDEFDLVLVDDMAGGRGGLLRALRHAAKSQPGTPVIVITSHSNESAVARAIRAGAFDSIDEKHLSRLAASVRRALRSAEKKRKFRAAEIALRESEERYRAFIANSSEGIWRVDLQQPISINLAEDEQIACFFQHAVFAECNDAAARMYGFNRGTEMVGLRVEDILPRDEQNIEHLRQIIRSGYRLADAETVERDRYGNVKYILNNVIGVIEDGAVVRAWGTQRDITSIRRVEHEIRASEARLRSVLDSAIDAIFSIDSNGRIIEFNPAAEALFGHRRDRIIGKRAIETLIPRRVQDEVRRELRRFVESGQSPVFGHYIELPGVRADGSEFPAEVAITMTRLGGASRPNEATVVTVFVRDISERVEAEAKLQRQLDERQSMYELSQSVGRADRLADVYEIALDALERLLGADRGSVLLLDGEGVMRFKAWRKLSDAYRAIVEGHSPWPPGERNPQPILVPDVSAEESLGDIRKTILDEGIRAMGFIPLVYESRLLGKFMVYYDKPREFLPDDVRLAQMVANHVAFAIQSRSRDEAAREQRDFLELILDINPNLIFAKDREGRFTLANRAVAEIYGTTTRDLLGKTDADFNPNAEEVAHFRRIDLEVMDALQEHATEEVITDAQGIKHWLYTVKRPIIGTDGKATHVLGVAVDITQRKRTEEELHSHREHLEDLVAERTRELELSHQQLRQSERLAMIGTLSTGLGHDMGNLLLPLRVRLDAMESRGLPAEFQDDTRAIRTFTEYLQRLSNGLRLMAQDPHDPLRSRDTTDLNEWWPDVLPVLKNALPSGVTLEASVVNGLPRVRVPRHVLTQVIFNLVQNAGDAMREQSGGRVEVWAQQAEGGDAVVIGVTDTGPGMSEEVLHRCMEPFFTTKPRGISTGLGLALVHGLVSQSGGRISIESEPGRGTTFALTFSSARSGDDEANGERPRAVVTLRDPRMRSHVASVLRSLAFEVDLSDQPIDPDVDVWVADADPRTLRLVREFASAGEHKHAMVLGPVPSGADFSRVTELAERPKPSEIWKAARAIAERYELQRKDADR